MEQTQRKLGGNIAALRRAKGLTQEQLAGLLGVSAPAVSKWETGASYPDITLLCPLARALDTNVDRLLQFEPDLSRSAVHEKIQEVIQFARGEAERQAGPDASLALLRSLLRQYPNSLELKLNGAAVLDAFWLIFPEAGPGCREQWQEEKQALLEAVWTGGDPIQRQTAALQLTSLALSTDKLEQAHTLLQELPKPVGDATMLWVQYYIKKGKPEEAKTKAQARLYQLLVQTLSCLTLLTNSKFMPQQGIYKAVAAYHAIARTFGLPDVGDGLLMALHLEQGRLKEAAACFARYVDALTGPFPTLDQDLFSPGVPAPRQGESATASREYRQLLLASVQEDAAYARLLEEPAFAAALAKLQASLCG